jgi:putative cell wall-binding protein
MIKKFKSSILFIVAAVLLLIVGACTNNQESHKGHDMEEMDHKNMDHEDMDNENMDPGSEHDNNEVFAKAPTFFNENATNQLLTQNTKNVTRIPTTEPIETSIYVSQTIWPATHKENQPGTVILAPTGNWQVSLASADLIHHPNNGPILFINNDSIPANVLNEIKRLNPIGNVNGTQVMIMGDVSESVMSQLADYKVEHIQGATPAEFAFNVDKKYAEVANGYPNSIIVVSSEDKNKLYSIAAVNWIAHMPEPVLYVSENEIPKETQEALKQRKSKANIYILGPEEAISNDLEKELSEYGTVKRIAGEDPISTSIEFAKFKDKKTSFGWGLTEPGHGVSFVSTASPELAIATAPFSHLGKHAPLIWIKEGELQKETYNFLALIKPTFKNDPTTGPYNHGFIVGDEKQIPFFTQGILDDKLEIVPESGGGHGGH